MPNVYSAARLISLIPVALSLTTRKTTAKQPDDEADHKACFHIFDHKTDRYPKYYQEPDAYPSPPRFFFFLHRLFIFWQPNQVSKKFIGSGYGRGQLPEKYKPGIYKVSFAVFGYNEASVGFGFFGVVHAKRRNII